MHSFAASSNITLLSNSTLPAVQEEESGPDFTVVEFALSWVCMLIALLIIIHSNHTHSWRQWKKWNKPRLLNFIGAWGLFFTGFFYLVGEM